MAETNGEPTVVFPQHVVVDNVPVITPTGSITNLTAITVAIGNLVVLLAAQVGVPLDAKGVATLTAAFNVVAAIVVWVRNTYFRNTVTVGSLDLEQKMSMRRVQ